MWSTVVCVGVMTEHAELEAHVVLVVSGDCWPDSAHMGTGVSRRSLST